MSTVENYSAMERRELEELKEQKLTKIRFAEREIRKLKKKFKSGQYDRQVICEHIISLQGQITGLIATIDGINKILASKELAPTQS